MLDETDEIHPLFAGAPQSTEFKKLRKRIVRMTREAIEQYGMVEPTAQDAPKPKWLVCLSGGKDSYTLLAVLHELQWRGLLPVKLLACNPTKASRISRRPCCRNSLKRWACRIASNIKTPIRS